MHCPRCGQQQASDQVKFCSRCGFLLELIPEILFNGGVLPQLAELNKNQKWLTRKNGLKFALIWMIFMLLIMTPLFGIAGADEATAIPAVLGVFGGFLMVLISFLFLDNKPDYSFNSAVGFRPNAMPQNLSGAAQQNALPPQQSVPVSSYTPPQPGRWQTTNDLTAPGSVTEKTTRLLNEEEK